MIHLEDISYERRHVLLCLDVMSRIRKYIKTANRLMGVGLDEEELHLEDRESSRTRL